MRSTNSVDVYVTTDKYDKTNRAILHDARITKSYEVSVYYALVDSCYNNTNKATVSIRTLANLAKTTPNSVMKAIEVLKECGYIKDIAKGDVCSSNTYTVVTTEPMRVPLDKKSLWYNRIMRDYNTEGMTELEVSNLIGGHGADLIKATYEDGEMVEPEVFNEANDEVIDEKENEAMKGIPEEVLKEANETKSVKPLFRRYETKPVEKEPEEIVEEKPVQKKLKLKAVKGRTNTPAPVEEKTTPKKHLKKITQKETPKQVEETAEEDMPIDEYIVDENTIQLVYADVEDKHFSPNDTEIFKLYNRLEGKNVFKDFKHLKGYDKCIAICDTLVKYGVFKQVGEDDFVIAK